MTDRSVTVSGNRATEVIGHEDKDAQAIKWRSGQDSIRRDCTVKEAPRQKPTSRSTNSEMTVDRTRVGSRC